MKNILIISFSLFAMGCSNEEDKTYDCGCTDELFLIEQVPNEPNIIEKVPVRLCDLYPYETVVENHDGIPNNYLYSTILFGTDIKEIARSQGCFK